MTERQFVEMKHAGWERLSSLLDRASTTDGLRRLSREELKDITPLYRRVSSDLAMARTRSLSPDLVEHLNYLTARAQAQIFTGHRSENPLQSVWQFYAYDFPCLIQKQYRYFLVALGLSILSAFYSYWLVMHHPALTSNFIPRQFASSVKVWKSGKVSSPASALFSGELMTHNITVSIMVFLGGILGGIPTFAMLFQNGAVLGALTALVTQVHKNGSLWPGILPHGIAELTSIFICGAAGFRLAVGMLLPGCYTWVDSFKRAGYDAIQMVLGVLPMLVFAGLIEGMFSHLNISPVIRLLFAGLNGTFWYLYLFLPRKAPAQLKYPAETVNLNGTSR